MFAVLVLALIPVLLMFTESELAPEEDQGIVFMMASAPKTANLDYLNAYTDQFLEIFKSFPEYYSWFQINGFDGVQSGVAASCSNPGTSANARRWKSCPRYRPSSIACPACRSSVSTCLRCPAPAKACRSSS